MSKKSRKIASIAELARRLGWNRSTLRLRLESTSWPASRKPPWIQKDLATIRAWQQAQDRRRLARRIARRKGVAILDDLDLDDDELDDVLLAGGPAGGRSLDRLRGLQCDIREVQLRQLQERLVDRGDCARCWAVCLKHLQAVVPTIAVRFGTEARDMLTDTLATCDDVAGRGFGSGHDEP